MTAPVHNGRTLDWRPRFDERSRAYAMAPGVEQLPATGVLWRPGRVLDQGREGACAGFAASGELAAEPVPVPRIGNGYALGVYRMAQRIDEWPGENYSGTSVLAVLKVLRQRQLCTGYGWAFTPEQLAAGIVAGGPAVIGVEWRAGSYETDGDGVLRPSGEVVGGHALCILGFIPAGVELDAAAWTMLEELGLADGVHAVLDTDGEDGAFIGINSWGPDFGRGGLFVLPLSVARAWCAEGWEAAQLRGRRQRPAARKGTQMADDEDEDDRGDSEEQQPATADDGEDGAGRTETLEVAATELLPGDRLYLSDIFGASLGRETVTVRSLQLTRGVVSTVRVTTRHGSFPLGAGVMVKVRRPASGD